MEYDMQYSGNFQLLCLQTIKRQAKWINYFALSTFRLFCLRLEDINRATTTPANT